MSWNDKTTKTASCFAKHHNVWARHQRTSTHAYVWRLQQICNMHDFNALYDMCHIIEKLRGAALAIFNTRYRWEFPFPAPGPVFLQGASGSVRNVIWMFLCAWFDGNTHTYRQLMMTQWETKLPPWDLATSCPWQIAEKETSSTVM